MWKLYILFLLLCFYGCNGSSGGGSDSSATSTTNNTGTGGSNNTSDLNPNGQGTFGTTPTSGNALSNLGYIDSIKHDSDYTYIITKSIFGTSKVLSEVNNNYFFEQSFYQTDGVSEIPMTNVIIATDITTTNKKGFVLSGGALFTKASGIYQNIGNSGSFINDNLTLLTDGMNDEGFIVRRSTNNTDWLVYLNNGSTVLKQLSTQLTTPIFGKVHRYNHKFYIVQTSGATRALMSISETIGTLTQVSLDITSIAGVQTTANKLIVIETQKVRADDSFHGSVRHLKWVDTLGNIGYPSGTQDSLAYEAEVIKSFTYGNYLYVWQRNTISTVSVDALIKIDSSAAMSMMISNSNLGDVFYGIAVDYVNNQFFVLMDDPNATNTKYLQAVANFSTCGYTYTSNIGTHCSTGTTAIGDLMPKTSYGALTYIGDDNVVSGDFYHPCYSASTTKWKLCKYSSGVDSIIDSHVSGNEYAVGVVGINGHAIYGRIYNNGTYQNDIRFY